MASQVILVSALVATENPAAVWTAQLSYPLFGCVIAVMLLPAAERRAIFRPEISVRMPRGFATYAASACATGVVATLVAGRSEVLVLDSHHLLAAAGVFTVVTGLAGQMTAPIDSLFAPLMPIAAGVFAIDADMARRAFRRSLRVSAALGALAMVALVPVGVALIEPIYGSRYHDAGLAFLVLGLVSCSGTVMGPVGAFAFATRSAQLVLRTQLVCLALDAALVFSLVPLIGLWGAVAANVGAQLAALVLLADVVSRRLGVSTATMAEDLGLFWLGSALGTAAGLVCAQLSGNGLLLTPVAVAIVLAVLWTAVRASSRLQFAEEDLDLLARGGPSRLVGPVIRGLRRAGVVQATPGT
jgi:O-antigen/teichoic acid export membrane protein